MNLGFAEYFEFRKYHGKTSFMCFSGHFACLSNTVTENQVCSECQTRVHEQVRVFVLLALTVRAEREEGCCEPMCQSDSALSCPHTHTHTQMFM